MSTTRRHFLGAATGASLARALAADQPQNVGPNDRIRIALIGAGGQGNGDARNAIAAGGVELAAVSDIYDGRLTRAREVWGDHVFTTRDYREVSAIGYIPRNDPRFLSSAPSLYFRSRTYLARLSSRRVPAAYYSRAIGNLDPCGHTGRRL